MLYAINGFPFNNFIFLSFKPFEPLLAGIIAKLFIFSIHSYLAILAERGPLPEYRQSFKPVRRALGIE